MSMIVPLWEVDNSDISLVGGKAASLGEMINNLPQDVTVPGGFVLTTELYDRFVLKILPEIKLILSRLALDLSNTKAVSQDIQELITATPMSTELKKPIWACKGMGRMAIRSSGTAEDLNDVSFAGMHETYLNVGEDQLVEICKKCFASLFSERAICYRERNGFGHKVSMGVIVQEMVESDASGVAFTADPDSGFKDVVIIESTWGLGETLVKSQSDVDVYMVYKKKMCHKPIIARKNGLKEVKTVFGPRGTRKLQTSKKERDSFTMQDEQILNIAKKAIVIEKHYGKPMDIEWAIKDGKIYILQARPLTGLKEYKVEKVSYNLQEKGKVLAEGIAVGKKIASGKARLIQNRDDFAKFSEGEVLVAEMTDPDWLPIMTKASAIVTDKGGRTSHSAIISRELGIPCIVGTRNATKELNGIVTVSCAEGERGRVYDGKLSFQIVKDNHKTYDTNTEIRMNINFSDMAFFYRYYPCNGVGMVRQEVLILENVGIHPKALIDYDELKSNKKHKKLVELIEERTRGYSSPKEYYIDRLALAMGKVAAAFYPRQVIIKLNDFKSNEYSTIPGGDIYEPRENNPIIGWRSARYYSEEYKHVFGAECEALRRVREDMGLENVHAMVPYCRTPEEGKEILKTMAEFGLMQGRDGFKVICEVEVPVSILLMDEYAEIFDEFQIGSGCLTQAVLCLDKDNPLTNHLFDERHPAMKKIFAESINKAHKYGKTIGIVGQAVSDYPEFTEFVIKEGIDSISLNPDPETFFDMQKRIAEEEDRLTQINA